MKRWIKVLALLSLLPVVFDLARAEKAEDVDYVELASVLVQDGHYDRAEAALLNVDLEDAEVDRGRFNAVFGLIHLNRGELEAARTRFLSAVELGLVDESTGETPEVIFIYLAQAHYGLEAYREAIEALDRAGATADRLSSTWVMRAHAHWLLGEREATWAVLDRAALRFPANTGFLRRKVFYLIELGLYQEAAALGRRYLSMTQGGLEDTIAIGNAMRKAGQYDTALAFLESARLRYPLDENVAKVLALTYVEMERPLAAANLFYEASLHHPALVSEASELYRRAGHLYRSLSLNAQIADPKKKLQQRLAILLELQQYDRVAGMEDGLIRAGLLDQEDLRYALAYAYFQLGDFVAAEGHLSQLTRPDLFRKAVELRKAIEECAQEPWRCS